MSGSCPPKTANRHVEQLIKTNLETCSFFASLRSMDGNGGRVKSGRNKLYSRDNSVEWSCKSLYLSRNAVAEMQHDNNSKRMMHRHERDGRFARRGRIVRHGNFSNPRCRINEDREVRPIFLILWCPIAFFFYSRSPEIEGSSDRSAVIEVSLIIRSLRISILF